MPSGIDGMAGVIAIETSVAGVTVNDVEPVTEPEEAEIVVEPTATLVALPPAAIVATPALEEFQVTDAVRSCVLPSVNVPVAVNACLVPSATDEFAGVTAIDTKAAGRMVKAAVLEVMDPEEALMFAEPVAMPDANPVILIAAAPTLDELQTADADKSWVVPSVKVPTAVNCWVVPTGMEAVDGVTAIDTNAACVTVKDA